MKKTLQKAPRSRSAWLRLGTLLFLILLSCAMLYRHRQTPPSPPSAAPTPAPSVQSMQTERSRREEAYDKDMASLEKLLESGAADADTQAQAARRMERMLSEHQSELALEEALYQAGFSPALVLVQNSALTVMVSAASPEAQTNAAILNLCVSHTDIAAENIRIMTYNP